MPSGKLFARLMAGVILLLTGAASNLQAQTISYTTNSTDALSAFNRGLEAYDEFDYVEASELFTEAISADSNFAMAWYYRALTSRNTARFVDDLAIAEKLSGGASEPERLIIESTRAINDGKEKEARADLEKLVTLVPDDARAYYVLGSFYFDRGEWGEADSAYVKAIDIDSSFAAAYDRLGYVYAFEEKYPEALETLRKYASLRPNSPKPYNSMGDIYLYMGKHDSSMAAYGHALSLSPDFVLSMVGEGNNMVFTDQFDSARVIFKQILLQAKTAADTNLAYSHAAWSYLYEGKPDKAIEALRAQLEWANGINDIYTTAKIYNELAAIFLEKGNCRHAMYQSDQVRGIATMPGFDPGTAKAYLRDANFVDAICFVQLDKPNMADSTLQAYREEAESSGSREQLADYHALAGIAAYWNEDYQRSIDELLQADPRDPFALFYLGLAYQYRGLREKARMVFLRVANFNHDSPQYALIRAAARDRLEE